MEREIITTPKSSGTGSTTELSSCGKAECDSTRYSKFMFSTQDPAPGRNKSKATVVPGEVNVSQILLSKTTLSIEDNPFRVLKYSEPYAFNYGTFMGLRGTTYKASYIYSENYFPCTCTSSHLYTAAPGAGCVMAAYTSPIDLVFVSLDQHPHSLESIIQIYHYVNADEMVVVESRIVFSGPPPMWYDPHCHVDYLFGKGTILRPFTEFTSVRLHDIAKTGAQIESRKTDIK